MPSCAPSSTRSRRRASTDPWPCPLRAGARRRRRRAGGCGTTCCPPGGPDRLRRGVPAPAGAPDAGHEGGRPGWPQGRPAQRQAGPVGGVHGLPRLRPGRRPALARLERLRAPGEAVHQAVRGGGGRHRHTPPRRLRVHGRRTPRQARVRQAGGGGHGVHRPRRRTTGSNIAVLQGARPRAASRPFAAPGACSRCWATCRASGPPPGPPTSLRRRATTRAQITQRGPLLLISDLFDPAADRAISELAGARCDVAVLHTLSHRRAGPAHRGRHPAGRPRDRRGRGHHRRPGRRSTSTGRAWPHGRTAWTRCAASAAWPTCRCRPRCRWRTSCTPSCGGGGSWHEADAMSLLAPLALRRAGHAARSSSRSTCSGCGARSGPSARPSCGSTWSATWRRTRRGSGSAAPCCCSSSCCSRRCWSPSWRVRSGSGPRGSRATWCWSSTHRRAWRRPTSSPTGSTAAKRAAIEALRDLPADGRVSVIAAARERPGHRQRGPRRGAREQAIESIEVYHGGVRPHRRAAPGGRARGARRRRRGAGGHGRGAATPRRRSPSTCRCA